MADVDRLLADYIKEHRTGGPADPREYLSRAEGVDRRELAALIDGYLARAPREQIDPAELRGTWAERVVESLAQSMQSETWSALLPELRSRAEIARDDLVARLATDLGVTGQQQKVAEYYNAMEHDQLEPGGVS